MEHAAVLRSLGVSASPDPAGAAVRKSKSAEDLERIKEKITHKPSLPQKLAALYYTVTFLGGIWAWILAFWLCTRIPLLWPVLTAYTVFIYTRGAEAAKHGTYPTPLRRWGMWRLMAGYFPARLHKTVDLPSGKPYIFCFHPHGILSFSAWLTFGTDALGFSRLFPGIDCRILTLIINFKNPFFREYLLLHGACDVSKRSCLNLLHAGKSIFIALGGGTESLYARPGVNDLVLNRRKGFVKIALRTGASLVPVYAFGENSTYRTANELPSDSCLRRFQRKMTKMTGFTVPLYYGTGLFLPWGFLPYPVPLDVVVGSPLEVPRYEGDEASAEFGALVDKYHGQYVAAVRELFEDNREKYAKGEAALQLVE